MIFVHANYINFIKRTSPSNITFGACKYVKKYNTTDVVHMHILSRRIFPKESSTQ